jgi:hypothetical protein
MTVPPAGPALDFRDDQRTYTGVAAWLGQSRLVLRLGRAGRHAAVNCVGGSRWTVFYQS